MKPIPCGAPCARTALRTASLAVLMFSPVSMRAADSPADPVALEFAEGLPGTQVRLAWPSEPGARYRVERSPDLSPGSFKTVAMVEATAAVCVWLEPEPIKEVAFYRVMNSLAEVFAFEPAVFSAGGGVVYLLGGALPGGSVLSAAVSGGAAFSAPLTPVSPGVWSFEVPPGLPSGGALSSLVVEDGSGVEIVADLTPILTVEITADGRASDGPASLPPAAPVPWLEVAIKTKGTGAESVRSIPALQVSARDTVRRGTFATSDRDPSVSLVEAAKKTLRFRAGADLAKRSAREIPTGGHGPTQIGMPGEVALHACDLELAAPAGPALRWIRTYRSLAPVESGHGPGWDHAYHIFIEPMPAEAGAAAPQVRVHDGGGCAHVLHRQVDGSYSAAGLFRHGEFIGDAFVLTFADQGTWTFNPLDGSPQAGKISAITDRFGKSVACDYDELGRLISVGDSFGKSLAVAWDDERISSVTDHSGRVVEYSYAASGPGAPLVLVQVSPPMVVGDPPAGGPLVYGYADHGGPVLSLVGVVGDGGFISQREVFEYSSTTDPAALDFRRLVAHTTSSGPATTLHYEALPDGSPWPRGYKVFHNDPTGCVTEVTCDAMHRPVLMRQLTGFAAAGSPVTSIDNRPTGPLRLDDPAHFDTAFSYNADHCLRRCTSPDGSFTPFSYNREWHPGGPARERGNPREMTLNTPGGVSSRSVSWDFLPNFGSGESARPGNPIKGLTIKGGRNPGGDIQGRVASLSGPWRDMDDDGDSVPSIARPGGPIRGASSHSGNNGGSASLLRPGNPIKGLTIKGGTNAPRPESSRMSPGTDDNDCDGETGGPLDFAEGRHKHKGWDGLIYRAYDEPDLASPLLRKDEGGRHTPIFKLHDCARRGITLNTSHVEYAHEVEMPALYMKLHYDGKAGEDSAIATGFPTRMVSAHGQQWTWSYTANGALSGGTTPVVGSGFSATHDADSRLASFTVHDGGVSHSLVVETGSDGYPSSIVIDPDGLALTTSFDYDFLGRITRVTDASGQQRLFEYDALDRCKVEKSPEIGSSSIATRYYFDTCRHLARIDHEHRDSNGDLVAANPEYTACIVRDDWGRVIRIAEEEEPTSLDPGVFDPEAGGLEHFSALDFTLDAAGLLTRCAVPAACRNATNDRAIEIEHDERGLVHRVIHGGADAVSKVACEYDYDLFGNVSQEMIGGGGLPPAISSHTYDGFQRLVSSIDPMGNEVLHSYGTRGEVSTEVRGETNDVPGSDSNIPLARVRWEGGGGQSDLPEISGLSLPGVTDVCYSLTVADSASSSSRLVPAFHGWTQRDATLIIERFTPGVPGVAEEITLFTCSPAGRLESIIRNADVLVQVSYDSAGRQTACWNAACRVETTLDALGRPVALARIDSSSANPAVSKTFSRSLARDQLGRCIASSAGGNTVTFTYDSCDRITRCVAPNGLITTIDYDSSDSTGPFFARCTVQDLDDDSGPSLIASCRVRCGELLWIRDHVPALVHFSHDEIGRITRVDFPDGRFTTASYDTRGHLHQTTLRDGSTCDYNTDLNGRAILTSYGSLAPGVTPVPPVEAAYDGLGRCVSLAQGTSLLTWTCDSVGNPVAETQDGTTITRTFNYRGRTGMSVVGSTTTTAETRDSLGRLVAVHQTNSSGIPLSPPVATFAYLGTRISRCGQSNGVVHLHTYRGDGDAALDPAFPDASHDALVETLLTKDGALILRERCSRSPNQAIVSTRCEIPTDADPLLRVRLFTLDPLDRTVSYQALRYPGGGLPPVFETDVSYTLTVDGARLTATGGDNPGSYIQDPTVPPGDLQMGRYSMWPGGPVTWDANGNLASLHRGVGGAIACVMDAACRLEAVIDLFGGTPLVSHTYDALGRRTTTSVHNTEGLPPQTTRFIYDGSVCIEEREGSDDSLSLAQIVADGTVHLIVTGSGTRYHSGGGLAYVGPCDASKTGPKKPVRSGPIKQGGDCNDGDLSYSVITSETGVPLEYRSCDDAGLPVFLTDTGLPTGSTHSALPIRWLSATADWEPTTRFLHHPSGTSYPDLGTHVIRKWPPYKPQKYFVGHITLMKQ